MDGGTILGIVAAVFTGLGVLLGGAWWMSSLHSLVKSNGEKVGSVSVILTGMRDNFEKHAKECDADRLRISASLEFHEGRLKDHDGKFEDHAERIVRIDTKVTGHHG
jgi:hypothetical protein